MHGELRCRGLDFASLDRETGNLHSRDREVLQTQRNLGSSSTEQLTNQFGRNRAVFERCHISIKSCTQQKIDRHVPVDPKAKRHRIHEHADHAVELRRPPSVDSCGDHDIGISTQLGKHHRQRRMNHREQRDLQSVGSRLQCRGDDGWYHEVHSLRHGIRPAIGVIHRQRRHRCHTVQRSAPELLDARGKRHVLPPTRQNPRTGSATETIANPVQLVACRTRSAGRRPPFASTPRRLRCDESSLPERA